MEALYACHADIRSWCVLLMRKTGKNNMLNIERRIPEMMMPNITVDATTQKQRFGKLILVVCIKKRRTKRVELILNRAVQESLFGPKLCPSQKTLIKIKSNDFFKKILEQTCKNLILKQWIRSIRVSTSVDISSIAEPCKSCVLWLCYFHLT